MRIMPQIINAGFYDAEVVHGSVKSTKPRRVSVYEFEFITENGGVSHIENNAYSIKKDCVICAKPGQIRHTELPYKCLYIHAIIEDEELKENLRAVPDFYFPNEPNVIKSHFNALISELNVPKQKNDLNAAIIFLEILSCFFNGQSHKNDAQKYSDKSMQIIRKAVKYIDENFTENITLNDIAAYVHFSKIYFHNFFIKATGQTPHDYLLSKRINNVKFLLTATDKSFSEIAENSGFSSQAYMTYVFKKQMLCTPSQYKKNQLEFAR